MQFFLTLMLQVSNSSSHSLYMSLGRIALVPLPLVESLNVPLPPASLLTEELNSIESCPANPIHTTILRTILTIRGLVPIYPTYHLNPDTLGGDPTSVLGRSLRTGSTPLLCLRNLAYEEFTGSNSLSKESSGPLDM
uniref:Uncharacterized protein n=1 Tax=Picea sitchensis TaxID=3332 RepID=A0A6B9XS02_PICSI|nr:hypothetical protein Q903MT_gene6770 [Picea sitchensis]